MTWPFGQGGKGNDGVAAVVSQTNGSIGYVEQAYAQKNKISFAVRQEQGRQVRQGHPRRASAPPARARSAT